MAKLLSDYVRTYDDTVSSKNCQVLIDRFESAAELHEHKQMDKAYSFVQLNVSRHWPDVESQTAQIFMACLKQYWRELDIGSHWPTKPVSEDIRMKRYLADGRDSFPTHVDAMDDRTSRRFITAILYLNDPGGGETIFSDMDVKITPAPGRVVVFPPLWVYPHAGMPPRDRSKYILHGYLWYPSADADQPSYPG